VLWIVKKGGQREAFDRDKLLKGLARACEKLSIPMESIYENGQNEVSSQMVGTLAMEELRKLHKVAYVRFASVYREFTDVSSFIDEVRRLHDERGDES
jgi:transcriptional repressor NrdR